MSKPVIRCKLCKLQKQNKPLWLKVHKKLFEENISQATVCAWLNEQVDTYNSNLKNEKNRLPHFNAVNFSLHLERHIPDRDKLQREMLQTILKPVQDSPTFSEEEKQEIDEIAYLGLGEQSESYSRLSKFVEAFIDRLTHYNSQLSNQNVDLSVRELTDLGNVLKSVVTAQKELTSMRNSDKLAGVAVRAAIEVTLASYLPLIVGAVERLRIGLQEELGAEASLAVILPNQLKDALLNKEVLQQLSSTVVLKIFEEFKIK